MKEGHIFIDGVIDEKMFQSVKQQIEANAFAEKLIVHMSSPGGSVYQGYKIYHKLKSLAIPKDGIIEGECMSIATFCIMACDKITALNPSRYMIHLPVMGIEGNSSDLENGARELQMIEAEMIQAYKSKTNIPEDQLKLMLKDEKYMDAAEAKRLGFVDEVDTRTLKAYAVGKQKTMNIDKNIFDNLGDRLAEFTREVKAMFSPKAQDMQTDKGVISIDSEDGMFEGKPVTISGQPAPDGAYTLTDGKIITVSGGMVASVKEAAPPAPAPAPEESAEDKLKKMEAENATMKAELDALKAAKAADEQKIVATEQNVATIQAKAMALAKDFDELKKKTIGDDNPPAGPTNHKKEPKGEAAPDYWKAETEAFIDEFLPQFSKNKK
jgi:ATP-dependent Clp endopeptidase proteolytic subunit ClpP